MHKGKRDTKNFSPKKDVRAKKKTQKTVIIALVWRNVKLIAIFLEINSTIEESSCKEISKSFSYRRFYRDEN